jgi:hypothetical protein
MGPQRITLRGLRRGAPVVVAEDVRQIGGGPCRSTLGG